MKNVRIGLLNHAFGRPNLGVDALSRSNIAILRSACERAEIKPEFVLFGKPGSDAPANPDVKQGEFFRLRHLFSKRLGEFRKSIARCDLIVDICAGDGFTDIYGPRLFMVHNLGKLFAIYSKRPVIFAPQTIGPFNKWWTRKIAQWIFNRSVLIFARDKLSTAVLEKMVISAPHHEVIDVAFSLPFIRPEGRAERTSVRVGINISGLLYNSKDKFQLALNYKELMHDIISTVLKKDNHEIWLVPHVIHDDISPEDDYDATEECAALFSRVKIAPRFGNAEEAKSFIASLDMFTGARMHACIAAISSGVPVMPIAYSRKFNGLFDTLEYSYMIDARAMTTKQALNVFELALDQLTEIKEACSRAMAIASKRLTDYEEVMCETMDRISGSK